jgi:hypothetical protein
MRASAPNIHRHAAPTAAKASGGPPAEQQACEQRAGEERRIEHGPIERHAFGQDRAFEQHGYQRLTRWELEGGRDREQ